MKNYFTGLAWMICCLTLVYSCSQSPHLADGAKNGEHSKQKNDSSINFLVLGDWGRSGSYHQKSVANQMRAEAIKRPVDFVLSMGDNFYPHGVTSTDDIEWRESFESVYRFKSLSVPWYTVFGNHDYGGSIQAQLDYGKINKRWATKDRYYSFEKTIPGSTQNVLFVFVDTNPFDPNLLPASHTDLAKQDTAAQMKWLQQILSSSSANWKIIIGHHPLFTTGARKSQTPHVRNSFLPLITKYQVNAYFAGHEHDLQYQKPDGPTHYFVSGGGSASRPIKSNEPYTRFAVSQPGFMAVQLLRDTMHVQIINYKGVQLYSTSIAQ